jgi:hypothetical protein
VLAGLVPHARPGTARRGSRRAGGERRNLSRFALQSPSVRSRFDPPKCALT